MYRARREVVWIFQVPDLSRLQHLSLGTNSADWRIKFLLQSQESPLTFRSCLQRIKRSEKRAAQRVFGTVTEIRSLLHNWHCPQPHKLRLWMDSVLSRCCIYHLKYSNAPHCLPCRSRNIWLGWRDQVGYDLDPWFLIHGGNSLRNQRGPDISTEKHQTSWILWDLSWTQRPNAWIVTNQ